MSNRYIEASAEDVASSVKVRVVLEEGERRVHLCNLPYHIVSGSTTDVVRCDFLADIIVRGIRSLEEERDIRCNRRELYLESASTLRQRLGRLMPGHGAG